MRLRVICSTAALVATWCASAGAQVQAPAPEKIAVGDWRIAPVVEARLRGEYRHDVDGSDGGSIVERARLGIGAERGALETRVVLQNARAWDVAANGAVAGFGAISSTGAYEAWIGARTASARSSFLRVGRQAVSWGEGRLLGDADWSPYPRSLDAVRGRLVAGDSAFELLGASLLDVRSPQFEAYGALAGARAQWAVGPLLAFEAYVLARFATSNPTVGLGDSVRGETYTTALRLHGDSREWTWGAEGAYQFGRARDLSAARSAWAAAAHVSYTLERVLTAPSVRLGASRATGDSGSGTYTAFDPLLPDVHTWHGAMDLFAWSNEQEVSVRVSIVPWTDGRAGVEYRYARLVEAGDAWRNAFLHAIALARSNTASDLGHEIDAWVSWSPWAPVDLSAGYSLLLLGDGARALVPPAGSASHFAYLQTTLRIP